MKNVSKNQVIQTLLILEHVKYKNLNRKCVSSPQKHIVNYCEMNHEIFESDNTHSIFK